MNKANTPAQERTEVDILNATILLIQLEGGRFMEHKQNAWDREDQVLTERGLELMEEAFKGVNTREFKILITEM